MLAHQYRNDSDAGLDPGKQRQMQFKRVLGRVELAVLFSQQRRRISQCLRDLDLHRQGGPRRSQAAAAQQRAPGNAA